MSMDAERAAHFVLSFITGIGPVTYKKIRESYPQITSFFTSSEDAKRSVIDTPVARTLERFLLQHRDYVGWVEEQTDYYDKRGITWLCYIDEHYPQQLRDLSDPPICLFMKGRYDPTIFSVPSLAIVGTRKPTSYGQQVARVFAKEIARQTVPIVSGLAIGIDAIAHAAALEAHGQTIAVLGCGVEHIYPAQNTALYHAIIKAGGIILSELPPGMKGNKGQFIARNRIVSGLAQGVLFVEGTNKSGTLATARYAALQGKDVYAVPGHIFSDNAQAPNLLIQQGAKLVSSPDDILVDYHTKTTPKHTQPELFTDNIVVSQLVQQSCSPSVLSERTNLSIAHILQELSLLEIEGLVHKNSDGSYSLISR